MKIKLWTAVIAGVLSLWFDAASAQNYTCPTQPAGDNETLCASTQFVQQAITGGGTGTYSPGQVLGNGTASTAAPAPTQLPPIIDQSIGATRGSILERGTLGWQINPPGTSGLPWVSNGPGADPGYQPLTTAGIANAAITSTQIANATITSTQIANATITGTQLAANTVANGNLATVPATTVKGSIAGGTPSDLTATQLTTLCNAFTSSLSGCAPASGGGTTNFLRADGSWTVPAGVTQSLVLLNTVTASNSAALADTTSLTSTYNTYMVVLTDIIPVTNSVQAALQISTNGGSSYLNTGYIDVIFAFSGTGSGVATLASGVPVNNSANLDNTAGEGLSSVFYIYNPSGGGNRTHFSGNTVFRGGGVAVGSQFVGWQDGGNTAANAFQLVVSSGNISSGTMKVYGIK
jgi:hypothetical protein